MFTFSGQQLVAWPIGSLRRYGVNNVCFTIEAGRYVASACVYVGGEGDQRLKQVYL